MTVERAARARVPGAWRSLDQLQVREAAERIQGVVRRTPLVPLELDEDRIDLRLKLENRQVTGSFKARGAWNQISRLDDVQKRRGVVASSSGNHGRALAWAARRAGVHATICMPAESYPNKIEACRELGAQVVLASTREGAEAECLRLAAEGATLIHPYDALRTIQGAGTVGLEIAQDWPEVEVVVVPVGGGGLISGSGLALRQELGDDVLVIGAEPSGAPSLSRGLIAGEPVHLSEITTGVQGLCPLFSGQHNIDVSSRCVDLVQLIDDEEIFTAQALLVSAGEVVEPAGAAATALVVFEHLPASALAGRTAADPLRVAAVVSGGNPDPAQLESVRAGF